MSDRLERQTTMPPRYAYWTLIVEGKPTAFRAQDRDELLPTMRQLQARHPDTVMMWFARGRLWTSREEALATTRRHESERRTPDWRPGGAHRDPRARFDVPRDEKRRRFAARQRRERQIGGTRQEQPGGPAARPAGRGAGRSPGRPSPAIERDRPRGPRAVWKPADRRTPSGGDRPAAGRPGQSGRPAQRQGRKPPGAVGRGGGKPNGGRGKPGGGRGRGGHGGGRR